MNTAHDKPRCYDCGEHKPDANGVMYSRLTYDRAPRRGGIGLSSLVLCQSCEQIRIEQDRGH